MSATTRPELIVAADWSVNDTKRWMTRATVEEEGHYLIHPPEPVGELESLLHRLQDSTRSGQLLLGLDLPIGFPIAYAEQTGFSSFRQALASLGTGEWNSFFDRSNTPDIKQPFFPPPPRPGETGSFREQLAEGLNVPHWTDLLRQCERKTAERPAAECLFFTCGGKQVGAAAAVAWQQVLQPALKEIRLWPFDGDLPELLSRSGATIAEVYPGESYGSLGLRTLPRRLRKKNRDSRREACRLLQLTNSTPWKLTPTAKSWFDWGFASDDDFDATIGLLHTILVVTGQIRPLYPPTSKITDWEGWSLGQQPEP